MNTSSPSTLVFSLGQGGYDLAFAEAVESQRIYCAKHGYSYTCISEPGSPRLGRENIWLKVLALYGALIKHDYVLYLDTDVRIQQNCPQLDQAVSEASPIGLVAGHSGRANAGAIMAYRTEFSLQFFAEWVTSLGKPLAMRHDVGWGENGHLIRLVEKYRIPMLETRWNNTFQTDLDDYMRHYTGPMRSQYEFQGESKAAWDKICQNVSISNKLQATDIITSFSELKEVYERTVPSDLFAPYNNSWAKLDKSTGAATSTTRLFETQFLYHIHLAEEISDTSQNAYVLTLQDGLRRTVGSDAVTSGVERFWNGTFKRNEVVHIEWIESLFGWKVPSDEHVAQFEQRMQEIAQTSPIVYTAHNFDLMPTYGENRKRMMKCIANNATMICHLSDANIEPYNRHHAGIPEISSLATAIVPHGDYQPYHRLAGTPFEDPALENKKIKILVFGHIRTKEELDFCLEVGEELGDTNFQMMITGAIHPDIIHWEKIHELRDKWDGGPRRIHFKVPAEQVNSLVSQCDGLLIPRFGRLNSGVQFLAFSMLKPAFVPIENSMADVQCRAMGQGLYKPHDSGSAADAIRQYFFNDPVMQLKQRYKINSFNYITQDARSVGLAHLKAYERAISIHRERLNFSNT